MSFASVPPGRYTFKVRGTNSTGDWSDNLAELAIFVQPRFYQTRWFISTAGILFSGSIVLLFLNWSRLSRQRQAELKKLVEERTRDLEMEQEELLQSYADLRGQTVKLKEKNNQVAAQNAVILAKSNELESINKELLTLNQEKNSLVGIVAHDLRSPAASVLNALQLLQLQPDLSSDERLELFKMMEDFLNKQLAMVSHILNSQTLETGLVDVRFNTVNIPEMCERMVTIYAKKANAKDIEVKADLRNSKISIQTDETLLEQILDNLLSNAVKFSPPKSTVQVLLEETETHVRIGVRDEGPGLNQDDLSKLFGKFQRLSAKPTGGEQSTGLGLSIVKRFVNALKGEAKCESEPGKGATFWVQIPR